MNKLYSVIILFILTMQSFFPDVANGRILYVDTKANLSNSDGSSMRPFRAIQQAALVAVAGDTVWVFSGVYREQVSPQHSGTSAEKPVVYMAAPGERVVIKGSEEIDTWQRVKDNIWRVSLTNAYFQDFNPYIEKIYGDWLAKGQWCHLGEVYLDEKPLREIEKKEALFENKEEGVWYTEQKEDSTIIYANFGNADPNVALAEINVRPAVFYPERPFVNYITVKGFVMMQAATPWAPPTTEQVGILGTHWSKGWVIEENDVALSKCVGITLGKYGDEWDNRSESEQGFIDCTQRAIANGWNREQVGSHIVRYNRIHDCGQAGLVGSLGGAYSRIEHNDIYDVALQSNFWGYEMAGIKLHGAVDVVIAENHIHHVEGGIWLDWMAQGTRITRNLLHHNRVQDLSLEVDHGPVLIDNNLFLSPEQAQIKLSQGAAFINNLIAWKVWKMGEEDGRKTPFLYPHRTEIAGFHPCISGNAVFRNNIFTRVDMSEYNQAVLPMKVADNLYFGEARPSRFDEKAYVDTIHSLNIEVEEKADGWYLSMTLPEMRNRKCPVLSSGDLGKATIPGQTYNEEGEKKVRLHIDYLGQPRKGRKTFAGPFAKSLVVGENRIKVYPIE